MTESQQEKVANRVRLIYTDPMIWFWIVFSTLLVFVSESLIYGGAILAVASALTILLSDRYKQAGGSHV